MTDFEKELEKAKLQYEGLCLEYDYIKGIKNKKIEEQRTIIEELKNELVELEKQKQINEKLQSEINKLNDQIIYIKKRYEESTSWKITKPLREIKKYCGKIMNR